MKISSSIVGASYLNARPFAFAFNAAGGASVNTPIAAGGYYLTATADCVVKIGVTTGPPVAAALPTAQPAITAPNATIYVPANAIVPLDVPNGSWSIAALGGTATTGTLSVIGPIDAQAMT